MNHRFTRRHLLAVTLAAGLTSTGLRAADPAPPASTVEQRLEQLEQEIRLLKEQRAIEKEAAAAKARETPLVKAGPDGFALQSADGNFALRLKGVLQFDSRWYFGDKAQTGTDTFLVRRARPILEATLYKDFDFRLMPDFGGGNVVLYDAYGEWKHWPWLKVRAGKFKSPVGLEQLQEDVNIAFTERSLATAVVPNRDVGVQLGGEVADGVLAYAVGVFNGTPDGSNGDLDVNDSKDFEGRIFVQPFKRTDIGPLQGLGLGVAGTMGNQSGTPSAPNLPSYKTSGQETFFKYVSGATAATAAVANGQRERLAPQGYYYWGPFGVLGEYTLSEQQMTRGTTTDRIRNSAWQVAGSWVLTGEHASFKGVTPARPFKLGTGQWGAVELVGRYNEFHADSDAFPTFADPSKSAADARAWGFGMNWYLNRNVKLMLDFEETSFTGGAGTATAVHDRPTEETLFTRAQFAF